MEKKAKFHTTVKASDWKSFLIEVRNISVIEVTCCCMQRQWMPGGVTILHLAIAVQSAPGILRKKVLKMTLKSLRLWSRWYQAGSLRMVVLVRNYADSGALTWTRILQHFPPPGLEPGSLGWGLEYPDQLDYSRDECYVFRKCSFYVFIQAIYFQWIFNIMLFQLYCKPA